MQNIDLAKYASQQRWEHDFSHPVSLEYAHDCYSKLPKAAQRLPEPSRPISNPSRPSRAVQIRSRAAFRAPSKAVQSPASTHPQPSRASQKRPKPSRTDPRASQKPSRTCQSRPEICGARPEPSTTCQNKLELLTQSFVHCRNCRAERVILQMRCSMGQSLHVKRHLGGAGTHAAGVRDPAPSSSASRRGSARMDRKLFYSFTSSLYSFSKPPLIIPPH